MTFEETEQFKLKHQNEISEFDISSNLKVHSLLIAPKEINKEERIELLRLSLSGIGNESALRQSGWLYKNLDVYAVFTADNINYVTKTLYDYLRENKKEP
jgi:hypothetical protein